jgi:hypothetical protein
MEKYHVYEKGTGFYITTLYSYTDVLNLQLFLQEKGTDLEIRARKLCKSERRKMFSKESA